MSKHIHTATADIETRLASEITRDYNSIVLGDYFDAAAKKAAVDLTSTLAASSGRQTGDKIIMRVSVKIDIERE